MLFGWEDYWGAEGEGGMVVDVGDWVMGVGMGMGMVGGLGD